MGCIGNYASIISTRLVNPPLSEEQVLIVEGCDVVHGIIRYCVRVFEKEKMEHVRALSAHLVHTRGGAAEDATKASAARAAIDEATLHATLDGPSIIAVCEEPRTLLESYAWTASWWGSRMQASRWRR